MPIFSYKCPSCGFDDEIIASFSETIKSTFSCPKCGAEMIRGIDSPNIGSPRHQNHAILENGRRVAGEFGKAARNK